MLSQPVHHTWPFPFFLFESTFLEEHCIFLETLFLQNEGWQHRDGAFYRCSLLDVTPHIPDAFISDILHQMRDITGLPLVQRVAVTAQRMLPGQVIGIHSDRPLLGYEAVRLVLQLNRHWQPESGGVLELYSSQGSDVEFRVNPEFNSGFGFLLNTDSYHGVTEVTQPRKTVVFNFWHAGNTPELAEYIKNLFTGMHFSELPEALNSVAAAAEENLPEELTFRAGTAAVALLRWGYNEAVIIDGYQFSAGLSVGNTSDNELYSAIRLADWVARLYRDSFDLERWDALRCELEGKLIYDRLTKVGHICYLG